MIIFKPRDIIAILAFAICAALLFFGHDGEVKAIMGVIIGYYFHGVENSIRAKKQNETQI